MPSLATFLSFALVAALLIAVPGPSVLFVVGRSLSLGRRGGLVSVLGNELGEAVLIAAVATGLGAVLAASDVVFVVIKFAGAAYLVYLGIQTIRHRKRPSDSATDAPREPYRQVFVRGFIVGVSNPKTLVFLAAVLPQFVDYHAGPVPLQLAALGAIFFVIALVSDSIWSLVASTARAWFASSPKRIERLDATGGVMMIGLGGVLAVANRSTS